MLAYSRKGLKQRHRFKKKAKKLISSVRQKTATTRQHDSKMDIASTEFPLDQSNGEIRNPAQLRPVNDAQGSRDQNDVGSLACILGCTVCPAYELSLCGEIREKFAQAEWLPGTAPLASTVHRVPARHTIFHHKEWSEFVPFICAGWAATSITLADGRRQTLSFLLPGDIVSAACLLEPMSGRTVEAITEVEYRKFRRSDLKAVLFKYPDLMEKVSKIWNEERIHFDQMALDLGRRTADERIARLIVNIASRLAKRGMRNGDTMEFPLRQRHIADATGLTPVHVSKVVGEFQRARLFEIRGRTLTIFDEAELRRAAEWR
ncbi:MAG: Crp/Fnr family transcriptional regulator [Pseudolabrys sp.]